MSGHHPTNHTSRITPTPLLSPPPLPPQKSNRTIHLRHGHPSRPYLHQFTTKWSCSFDATRRYLQRISSAHFRLQGGGISIKGCLMGWLSLVTCNLSCLPYHTQQSTPTSRLFSRNKIRWVIQLIVACCLLSAAPSALLLADVTCLHHLHASACVVSFRFSVRIRVGFRGSTCAHVHVDVIFAMLLCWYFKEVVLFSGNLKFIPTCNLCAGMFVGIVWLIAVCLMFIC